MEHMAHSSTSSAQSGTSSADMLACLFCSVHVSSANMLHHIRYHLGYKPLSCVYCGLSYVDHEFLAAHATEEQHLPLMLTVKRDEALEGLCEMCVRYCAEAARPAAALRPLEALLAKRFAAAPLPPGLALPFLSTPDSTPPPTPPFPPTSHRRSQRSLHHLPTGARSISPFMSHRSLDGSWQEQSGGAKKMLVCQLCGMELTTDVRLQAAHVCEHMRRDGLPALYACKECSQPGSSCGSKADILRHASRTGHGFRCSVHVLGRYFGMHWSEAFPGFAVPALAELLTSAPPGAHPAAAPASPGFHEAASAHKQPAAAGCSLFPASSAVCQIDDGARKGGQQTKRRAEEATWECGLCWEAFAGEQLSEHVWRRHVCRLIVCETCGASMESDAAVFRHINRVHAGHALIQDNRQRLRPVFAKTFARCFPGAHSQLQDPDSDADISVSEVRETELSGATDGHALKRIKTETESKPPASSEASEAIAMEVVSAEDTAAEPVEELTRLVSAKEALDSTRVLTTAPPCDVAPRRAAESTAPLPSSAARRSSGRTHECGRCGTAVNFRCLIPHCLTHVHADLMPVFRCLSCPSSLTFLKRDAADHHLRTCHGGAGELQNNYVEARNLAAKLLLDCFPNVKRSPFYSHTRARRRESSSGEACRTRAISTRETATSKEDSSHDVRSMREDDSSESINTVRTRANAGQEVEDGESEERPCEDEGARLGSLECGVCGEHVQPDLRVKSRYLTPLKEHAARHAAAVLVFHCPACSSWDRAGFSCLRRESLASHLQDHRLRAPPVPPSRASAARADDLAHAVFHCFAHSVAQSAHPAAQDHIFCAFCQRVLHKRYRELHLGYHMRLCERDSRKTSLESRCFGSSRIAQLNLRAATAFGDSVPQSPEESRVPDENPNDSVDMASASSSEHVFVRRSESPLAEMELSLPERSEDESLCRSGEEDCWVECKTCGEKVALVCTGASYRSQAPLAAHARTHAHALQVYECSLCPGKRDCRFVCLRAQSMREHVSHEHGREHAAPPQPTALRPSRHCHLKRAVYWLFSDAIRADATLAQKFAACHYCQVVLQTSHVKSHLLWHGRFLPPYRACADCTSLKRVCALHDISEGLEQLREKCFGKDAFGAGEAEGSELSEPECGLERENSFSSELSEELAAGAVAELEAGPSSEVSLRNVVECALCHEEVGRSSKRDKASLLEHAKTHEFSTELYECELCYPNATYTQPFCCVSREKMEAHLGEDHGVRGPGPGPVPSDARKTEHLEKTAYRCFAAAARGAAGLRLCECCETVCVAARMPKHIKRHLNLCEPFLSCRACAAHRSLHDQDLGGCPLHRAAKAHKHPSMRARCLPSPALRDAHDQADSEKGKLASCQAGDSLENSAIDSDIEILEEVPTNAAEGTGDEEENGDSDSDIEIVQEIVRVPKKQAVVKQESPGVEVHKQSSQSANVLAGLSVKEETASELRSAAASVWLERTEQSS